MPVYIEKSGDLVGCPHSGTDDRTRKDRATQPMDQGRLRWAKRVADSHQKFKFQMIPLFQTGSAGAKIISDIFRHFYNFVSICHKTSSQTLWNSKLSKFNLLLKQKQKRVADFHQKFKFQMTPLFPHPKSESQNRPTLRSKHVYMQNLYQDKHVPLATIFCQTYNLML